MKKKDLLKQRDGAALIWVLIIFTILMILTSSLFLLIRQNLLETINQEERLQTYYIALSGLDLTYAALMDPSNNPKKINEAIQKIKSSNKSLIDTIIIEIDGGKSGTATVTIDRVKENDINWLRITSVGQITGNSSMVTSTMRINEDNHNHIVREKINK